MTFEILYTSAPSGLRPGSSGYCTVQSSRGIPAPTVESLESLSGYRHQFPLGHPQAHLNPVNYGHYLIRIGGRREHVLSRVSDYELDYTGRSNKLAHHLVVDDPGAVPGGPACLLKCDGWMRDEWDGEVCLLTTNRVPSSVRRPPAPCVAWEQAIGDAGWAGVLAESFLADPTRKVFVIFPLGTNLLDLFDEALSLLPESKRWSVTFATYGAALPATVDTLWNGLLAGSPEVDQSRRFIQALRIDLASNLGQAKGGALVTSARTGILPVSLAASRPSGAKQPPLEESFDEYDLQEVEFHSAPLPTGRTVPHERIEPPSLPSSRPWSHADSSNFNSLPYLVGAVVAGTIITASVAMALFWSRPPEPAKPVPSAEIALAEPNNRLDNSANGKPNASDWSTKKNEGNRDGEGPHSDGAGVVKNDGNHDSNSTAPAVTEQTPQPAASHPGRESTSPSHSGPPANPPPAAERIGVAESTSIRPYAICITGRKIDARTEGPSKVSFSFKATLNHPRQQVRFMVPASNENRIASDFRLASAKIENPDDRNVFQLSIAQDSKHQSNTDPWLLFTLPLNKDASESADFSSKDSVVVMKGPPLEHATAVPFSGCFFQETRPILLLFRASPPRPASVPYDSRESLFDLLSNDKPKRELLVNDLRVFETNSPDVLQYQGLAVRFPDEDPIELVEHQGEHRSFVANLPDRELGKQITITATAFENSVGSLKLKIDVSPSKSSFITTVRNELEAAREKWREFGKIDSRFLGVKDKEEDLNELENKVNTPAAGAFDQAPNKVVIEQGLKLIHHRKALVQREKKIKTFFEIDLPKMRLVSGRITYRLMELGDSQDDQKPEDQRRTFHVDVLVIGDTPTDIDYGDVATSARTPSSKP